jgi:fructokinase
MSVDPSMERPLCVGIGEVLWDLLPGGKSLGGAPINAAAHAAQLGARSAAISGVGDDDEGREIVERLRALQVDAAAVRVVQGLPTGMVDVKLDETGVPTFSIRIPAAWDAIEMDAMLGRLARTADAVIFGSLAQRDRRSRKGIRQFLHALRPECLKVFDVNLRPPFYSAEIIRSSLELANVLKLNDAELPALADSLGIAADETTQLHTIRERFDLDLVVYTRGDRGSRMVSAQRDESHPGYQVRVVDTVGAGDAFTAAVTIGLLRGLQLDSMQELANRVAAFVCSQPGAVPLLPEDVRREFYQSRTV